MAHAFVDSGTRGQFAGHETFPLRLLWLKKAYDAVRGGATCGIFQEQSAIARFGVGRNMAVSMRFWGLATGFLEERDRVVRPSWLGDAVLADDGYDPYLERSATIWLAHWGIASTPQWTTTSYFAFNVLSAGDFETGGLTDALASLVEARGWRATPNTLKRDVDVFLRSYVRRAGVAGDDAAEPLLAELGLIRESRSSGWHEFVRGPKPTLPDGVFALALTDFHDRRGASSAITAEEVCYAPGSPGRVFKLDEDAVLGRLMGVEGVTDGAWRWTDTAGLRQVQRLANGDRRMLVARAYGSGSDMRAAS